MADHAYMQISIGGKLLRQHLDELVDLISDGGLYDPNSLLNDKEATRDFIETCAQDGSHVWLVADEMGGGDYPELAAFCRKIGLSYSRSNEANIGVDATASFWGLGMKAERFWVARKGGTPCLDCVQIRDLAARGKLVAEVNLMSRAENFNLALELVDE